jgi:hypothetical protein
MHQAYDVLRHGVVDEDLFRCLLQLCDLLRGEYGVGVRPVCTHPLQDGQLLERGRVVDRDLQQEPVPLRFGQRVDAVGLDRVLRREDEERLGQLVAGAADADLVLGHRLQQGGLHLGGCAVDLVREYEVGEDRAELGVEALGGRPPDPGADDVAGYQVGGELQPGEPAADHLRQRPHRERLRHPGHAFQQTVPTSQQPDQHPLDQVVLPDDDPLHLEQRVLEDSADTGGRCRHGGPRGVGLGHAFPAGFCSGCEGCSLWLPWPLPFFSGQSAPFRPAVPLSCDPVPGDGVVASSSMVT